jgi:PAS domain S-box-containing protein
MHLPLDRLQQLFDLIDYHVAIYDRDWRYTYVNAEAARMLGRAPHELLGRSIWSLFPETVGSQYYRELHEVAARGNAVHSQHYHPSLERWFEHHIYPLPDGVIVLSRDVTAERHAGRRLQEHEEMLRLAQKAGGVGTFDWDFERLIAQCSAEYFRIFGLPEQDGQMTAAEWREYVHADDRERMDAHLQRALAGHERPAADYRIRTARGDVRWLTYSGTIHRTAAGMRMIGTVTDVTERKRTEEALRRSEERLRLALDAAQMIAWDWDLSTDRATVWPSAASVLGTAAFERISTSADAMQHLLPEDRMRHQTIIDEALRTASGWISEFRFVRPSDRTIVWVEDRGKVYTNDAGVPVSASGVRINISERKRLEEELRAHADELEEANSAKDEFLATLSHELRTPLNVVRGRVRMLRQPLDAESLDRVVDAIERNSLALEHLVADLIDVARMTRGQLQLACESLQLSTVVHAAIQTVQSAAAVKRISLSVDMAEPLPDLWADPNRLQQVIWNLLNNAVKFTPDDGAVTVSACAEDGKVVMRVRDTGIGLTEAERPHIFETFWQAEPRMTRRFGGLGLGLSIARRLVELHGARIEAFSPGPNAGTTFTIAFPAAPARR